MRILYRIILIFVCSLLILSACNNNENKSTARQAHTSEVWTCSMHPQIMQDHPGSCPICGMDLIKKEQHAAAVTNVSVNDLLRPTDQFVVSSIAVTTLIKKDVSITINALGMVTYDTRLINTISARVSGRIDKIYVRYRYQHVHKGERIMDIYSPEIQTTQQELLFLLEHDRQNQSLINAARQKLILLGMSDAQLQRVLTTRKPSATITVYSPYTGHLHEASAGMSTMQAAAQQIDVSRTTDELPVKEGMYVQKGQTVFQLFNTDKSWVVLNIFPEDREKMQVGSVVSVIPEAAPGQLFQARIDFIEPVFRPESKTLTARVYFDNTERSIPIGSPVRATIEGKRIIGDWLPKDAVLSLGLNKVVFVHTNGGFQARAVQTGTANEGWVQITAGIQETDSVAANAQYLMDSDNFIQTKP
jgi:Cu(I)/Ag(I) efflux system membrane fusion protein